MLRNREEFTAYVMRRLGAPVITINVDAEQVQDRIDEALRYYIQYHYNGTERDVIAVVCDDSMVATQRIPLPANVVAVLRALPSQSDWDAALQGAPNPYQSDGNISLNYSVANIMSTAGIGMSLKAYTAYRITNDVMKYVFRPEKEVSFRFATGSVSFDATTRFKAGDTFFFEVYSGVDPDTHLMIWEDIWLQEFATALVKLQWGSNLIKYDGVQLPTGITLNGSAIYTEAKEEREKLIERLHDAFTFPADFFLG